MFWWRWPALELTLAVFGAEEKGEFSREVDLGGGGVSRV